ncbi:MAG: 50S ribosomal protein L23 [Deltaproteobacteria bacterium]|nr:50S ribosomal protein L23 [Deltaproteobacteria bacterium]
MKAYHHLIRGPIITEKTHALREANNKLTLKVDVKANKIEIRKAIETLFKVKVLAVNTIQMMGKKKRLGKTEGSRPNWKKAIVTLAPGEKIAGYEGL